MTTPTWDALVFFVATDDLAHKQIFPALTPRLKSETVSTAGTHAPFVTARYPCWSRQGKKAHSLRWLGVDTWSFGAGAGAIHPVPSLRL
jgi:hypothetical protein